MGIGFIELVIILGIVIVTVGLLFAFFLNKR